MTKQPEDFAEQFFAGNAASYDHIARVSTLGLDAWWKRKILNKIPKTPGRILEQASGTGLLTFKLAKLFPDCRIVGVELQKDYLDVARQKARDLRLTNVEFIHGRAEDVIVDGTFDCIVSDYLAKYVELDRLVANARTMLRAGGLILMHEFTRPAHPFFAALWQMHFKALRIYGKWHPEWDTAFRDLPLLLEKTRWVDELTHALRANRFSHITIEHQLFGASAIVSARLASGNGQ